MKTLFKLIGWLIGSALLLLVAAIILVPLIVDPNDYREELTALVEKQTGRTLTIEGDLQLSLFPWVGVSLGNSRLSNAEGFGSEPMASVEQVDLRVQLMPLLERKVEMQTIVLHGLHLSLGRDAEGRGNWEDLGGDHADAAAPTAGANDTLDSPSTADDEGKGSPLESLAIGGLDLRDARVVWDDRSAGQKLTIDNLSLTTSALGLNTPFDLALELDLALGVPQLAGHLALGGKVTLDLDGQKYTVDDLTFNSDLKGAALPGGALAARLGSDVHVDLAAQTLQLADLTLSALGLQLSGSVDGSKLLEAPLFSGKLAVAPFVPRDVLATLGLPDPVSADPSTLTKADLSFAFNAGLDSARLDALKLRLDQTTLEGKLAISRFAAPRIRYALTVDAIDVDRYLPPKPPKPAEGEQPAGTETVAEAPAAEPELPLELLRGLDIDGSLNVGKLKVANLTSEQILIGLKAAKGKFHLNPLAAKLYQGGYQGNIGLDVSSKRPRISLDEKLTGVQAGPLLQDMLGKPYVTGTANVSAQITTAGLSPEKIRAALNGKAEFSFTDGAVEGISIGQLIRQAEAKLKRQEPPAASESTTDFAELRGSFTIHDGVVSGDDLTAKSPLLRVAGKGTVDLVRELLDYRVDAFLVKSMEGQGGQEAGSLSNLPVPVSIKGPFSAPEISLEYDELLKAHANQALEAEKAKARAALEKKKAEAAARLEAEKAKFEEQKKAKEAELRARLEAEKKKKEQELRDKAASELQKLFR